MRLLHLEQGHAPVAFFGKDIGDERTVEGVNELPP